MSIENDPRSEHIYAHPYFLRGVAFERERIIALLEAIDAEPDRVTWDRAIALIKGESDVPEIPQFEGTRAALDNLTIKAENE